MKTDEENRNRLRRQHPTIKKKVTLENMKFVITYAYLAIVYAYHSCTEYWLTFDSVSAVMWTKPRTPFGETIYFNRVHCKSVAFRPHQRRSNVNQYLLCIYKALASLLLSNKQMILSFTFENGLLFRKKKYSKEMCPVNK